MPRQEFDLSFGAWTSSTIEAAAAFDLGDKERSDAILARLKDGPSADTATELSIACVYAWRGENDLAFEWLDATLDRLPNLTLQFSHEACFHRLVDDPRWDELLERWTGNSPVGA